MDAILWELKMPFAKDHLERKFYIGRGTDKPVATREPTVLQPQEAICYLWKVYA